MEVAHCPTPYMPDIAWLASDNVEFPSTHYALDDPNGLLAAGGDLTISPSYGGHPTPERSSTLKIFMSQKAWLNLSVNAIGRFASTLPLTTL